MIPETNLDRRELLKLLGVGVGAGVTGTGAAGLVSAQSGSLTLPAWNSSKVYQMQTNGGEHDLIANRGIKHLNTTLIDPEDTVNPPCPNGGVRHRFLATKAAFSVFKDTTGPGPTVQWSDHIELTDAFSEFRFDDAGSCDQSSLTINDAWMIRDPWPLVDDVFNTDQGSLEMDEDAAVEAVRNEVGDTPPEAFYRGIDDVLVEGTQMLLGYLTGRIGTVISDLIGLGLDLVGTALGTLNEAVAVAPYRLQNNEFAVLPAAEPVDDRSAVDPIHASSFMNLVDFSITVPYGESTDFVVDQSFEWRNTAGEGYGGPFWNGFQTGENNGKQSQVTVPPVSQGAAASDIEWPRINDGESAPNQPISISSSGTFSGRRRFAVNDTVEVNADTLVDRLDALPEAVATATWRFGPDDAAKMQSNIDATTDTELKTQLSETFTYATAGLKQISLELEIGVVDDPNAEPKYAHFSGVDVIVGEYPTSPRPNAAIDIPDQIEAGGGNTFTLDGTNSYVPENFDQSLQYTWYAMSHPESTIDDGQVLASGDAQEAGTAPSPASIGYHRYKLEVSYTVGSVQKTATAWRRFTVTETPTANITLPRGQTFNVADGLQAEPDLSRDPDDRIVSCLWTVTRKTESGSFDEEVYSETMDDPNTLLRNKDLDCSLPLAGEYEVELTVRDSEFSTADTPSNHAETTTRTVTADTNSPTAEFTVSDDTTGATVPIKGHTITLDGSLSADTDGVREYHWKVVSGTPSVTLEGGAGSTSFGNLTTDGVGESEVRRTTSDSSPAVAGSLPHPDGSLGDQFTVVLKVTDDYGAEAIKQRSVRIGPVASLANQSIGTADVGELVTLDASATVPDVPGQLDYSWTVGYTDDGDSHTGSYDPSVSETTETVQRSFGEEGSYPVSVDVAYDSVSSSDSADFDLVTEPPTASFSIDGTPYEDIGLLDAGSTITLDASGSTDPDGSIVSYEWTILENYGSDTPQTEWETTSLSGQQVSHTLGRDAPVTITLEVVDDAGYGVQASRDWSSLNYDPAARISVTGDRVDETITIDGTGSSDSQSLTYDWQITGPDGYSSAGSGSQITRNFDTHGTYTAELRVVDPYGSADTATQSFSVADRSASISIYDNQTYTTERGSSVSLGAYVDDDDGSHSVSWYHNGNRIGGGTSVSTTFYSVGTKTVRATVTDETGASSSDYVDVEVTAGPQIDSFNIPTTVGDYNGASCSASATDPDGGSVSYDWYLNGGHVGSGSSTYISFGSTGYDTVKVKVTDDEGQTATRSGSVQVYDDEGYQGGGGSTSTPTDTATPTPTPTPDPCADGICIIEQGNVIPITSVAATAGVSTLYHAYKSPRSMSETTETDDSEETEPDSTEEPTND